MITADRFDRWLLSFDYLKEHAFDQADLDFDSGYGDSRVLRDPDTGEDTPFTGLTYISYDDITLDGYTFYVNGVRQGQYVRFHRPGGALKTFGHQMNNSPDGTWYEFYETGALKRIDFYARGRCFACRAYDEDGVITGEVADTDADLIRRLDALTA